MTSGPRHGSSSETAPRGYRRVLGRGFRFHWVETISPEELPEPWVRSGGIVFRTRVGTGDGGLDHEWSTVFLVKSMGVVAAGLGGGARTTSMTADRSSHINNEEPTVALVLCWC